MLSGTSRNCNMSRVDPKQAAIFIGVLLVIASFINGIQDSRQRAGSGQTVTQQPIAEPQQQIPAHHEAAPTRVTEDVALASRRAAEDAAEATRKAAADAAAAHARYL